MTQTSESSDIRDQVPSQFSIPPKKKRWSQLTRRKKVGIAVGGAMVLFLGWLIWGPDWEDVPNDEIAVHYGGGMIEDAAFKGTIAPGSSNAFVGPGDSVFKYPVGQQTYQVNGAEGADAAPIVVVTGDGIRVEISGQAYFTLNTDDEALRTFHERIGLPGGAYVNGGYGGWDRMLETYLLPQLDRSLDTITLKYDWLVLRSDAEVRRAYEAEVSVLAQELVRDATGGDYLCQPGYAAGDDCQGLLFGVDRLKPMNTSLSTSIEDQLALDSELEQEQRRLDAELAQENRRLEAEQEQQRIRNETTALEMQGVRSQIAVLGVDGYIAKIKNDALLRAIESGAVEVYVLPDGSPVQIQQ